MSGSGNLGTLPNNEYSISNANGIQFDSGSKGAVFGCTAGREAMTIEVWFFASSNDDNMELLRMKTHLLKIKYFKNGMLRIRMGDLWKDYNSAYTVGGKLSALV